MLNVELCMVNEEGNPVRDKSYAFALRVIGVVRQLREQKEYELAGQLLRAGTSIGANVEEAQAAQSRADFVAKMSIAAKEARETHYWLRLLRDSKTGPPDEVAGMLHEADELIRLLTAIVKTGQRSAGS
jgi:four helix bundle protein